MGEHKTQQRRRQEFKPVVDLMLGLEKWRHGFPACFSNPLYLVASFEPQIAQIRTTKL